MNTASLKNRLSGNLRNAAIFALLAFMTPAYLAAEPAPGFSLADAEGNQRRLEDYAGSPLILHFWASWCPYCKKLQPGLEGLAEKYKTKGLVVLGINFREDEGVLPQAVLADRGLSFLTLIEGDEAAQAYGVKGTPTTFFIDRDGQIVDVSNTSNPNDPILTSLSEAITEP